MIRHLRFHHLLVCLVLLALMVCILLFHSQMMHILLFLILIYQKSRILSHLEATRILMLLLSCLNISCLYRFHVYFDIFPLCFRQILLVLVFPLVQMVPLFLIFRLLVANLLDCRFLPSSHLFYILYRLQMEML